MTDEEMTASMRRYHQQRRDYILKMLEDQEKKTEKKKTEAEENEIKSLVNLNEMTFRMMAGVTTSLPVFIPLQSAVTLEE
jgi:hypothetical protein